MRRLVLYLHVRNSSVDIGFQSDAVQKEADKIEHVVEETEQEAKPNEFKQDVAKETASQQKMEEAIEGEHVDFMQNVTELKASVLTNVENIKQVVEVTEQVGAVTQSVDGNRKDR